MNKPPKMNVLYKIAFILMLVCVAAFAAALVLMVVFESKRLGVPVAVAGVTLCMVSIVLSLFSKPKKPKKPNENNSENELNETES